MSDTNDLLVIIEQPPTQDLEALELALACAAFDQLVALLFQGAGLLWLLPEQSARRAQGKSAAKLMAALGMYDVEQVFYCADSAERFAAGLAQQFKTAQAMDSSQQQVLLAGSRQILTF